MKKFILFAVLGVLFAPLAFAQDEDQTLEFHPSAWKKPVSRMIPMKPEMPSVSSEATESVVPETSEGGSFSEADMESLKRQLEKIEQELQALRTEKEAVMQKMKGMRHTFRETKKELKKEIREEKREMKQSESEGGATTEEVVQPSPMPIPWQPGMFQMKKEIREEKKEMKEEESGGMEEGNSMEEAMPPLEMPIIENEPMEMKTPRMGFTPFKWRKDTKPGLSTTPEFKVTPKMLQQSIIRPPLSAGQEKARGRQADAKERLMKLRKVGE
jgi:hypothetical protein